MRPVCIACQIEMTAAKTGALLESMTVWGPHQLWSVDVFECSGCHVKVGARFAAEPVAHAFTFRYDAFVKERFARYWQNERERDEYQANCARQGDDTQ